MNSEERIAVMRKRLEEKFAPSSLQIIDDSHKHIGHAGSKDGAGHYTVIIKSDSFKEKSRVEVHREIYAALEDLMPREIHALVIQTPLN